MPDEFEIAHAERFPFELGRAPRKVQRSYGRTIVPILKLSPLIANPPQIKKLSGYKDLWRIRISDEYRLVYRVDQSRKTVILLMLDHRANIYERLGANADGSPGTRIIINAEDLVERDLSPDEIGHATMIAADIPVEKEHRSDNALPQKLNQELLRSWNIPEKYYDFLKKISTEGQLLAVNIPDDVKIRIMDGLWPSKIEDICQQPTRMNYAWDDLEDAAEGNRSLESFLLCLDDEQKAFANRFTVSRPSGPWLLKGGPGSGKSTVALHCIRNLQNSLDNQLRLDPEPKRILFTTYTNSLISASKHLLKMLPTQSEDALIDVINVDRLAARFLDAEHSKYKIKYLESFIKDALRTLGASNKTFAFGSTDIDFLEDEIEWVIFGQGIKNLEGYLTADRSGRGRQLGQNQRRQLWQLFENVNLAMRVQGAFTYTERILKAFNLAKPSYDYVFIDEAQDLKPIAVRLCIKLCKNPQNIFLTADSNQSIYGSGMSWSKIASDLSFLGRAKNLKKNYRTTKEIWDAVTLLAPQGEGADKETLEVETVFNGEFPTLALYSDPQEIFKRIDIYLQQALIEERVPLSSVAILCPNHKEMKFIESGLDRKYNAKAMGSKNLDLSHPGIKVTTMHAAKGLQFPIVIVTGIEKDILPKPAPSGVNLDDHITQQKRLLFVACSRAMRRLLVFASANRPSQFARNWNDELWDIETI